MKVKIDNIIINGNRRKVDEEKVKTLAESVNEIGLLNPITINARYELIAGLHRLEAHKQLGIDEIDAIILDLDDLHTELAEIDENLIRNELSPAEISVSIAKRKRIYEELYPETKFGSSEIQSKRRKEPEAESATGEIDSFVEDTAKKTNMAERTVREYQQIGTTIPEDILSNVDKDTTKQTLIEVAREVKQATKEKDKGIRELEKEYREVTKDDTMLLLEEEKRRADELERKLKEERELREQIAKQEAERLLREKEEDKRKDKEERKLLAQQKKEILIEKYKNYSKKDAIKILEGDIFDLIGSITDKTIDLLVTDPPYMVLEDEWDVFKSKDEFLKFTENWIKLVLPKVKDTGRIYISFAPDMIYDLYSIFEKNNFFDFMFGNTIIWVKKNNNKVFSRLRYRLTYEPILYLYGKDCNDLNFTEDTFGEMQTDVWEIATPQSNFKEGKYHSAQKPIELYTRIIKTGSQENDIVLDCFAGSGTTGIVCENLHRRCILIEKDLENIKMIKGRLANELERKGL